MKNRLVSALGTFAFACLFLLPGRAMALDAVKPQANNLASKEFYKPELHISSNNVELPQV
jgi:hypothetical protein